MHKLSFTEGHGYMERLVDILRPYDIPVFYNSHERIAKAAQYVAEIADPEDVRWREESYPGKLRPFDEREVARQLEGHYVQQLPLKAETWLPPRPEGLTERQFDEYVRDWASDETSRLRAASLPILAELIEIHRANNEEAESVRAAEERARIRSRPSPRPEPQQYGVSHAGAERLVCDWMRHLGVLDAQVTRAVQSADGGIDVDAEGWVAQVKNVAGSVGVDVVRQLFGVAAAIGKQPLFWTSGQYTSDAITFADAVDMPLIRYDAEEGTLRGMNSPGSSFVVHGVEGEPTSAVRDD